MVLHCRLFSEGHQRKINTKGASGSPKTIKEKNYLSVIILDCHLKWDIDYFCHSKPKQDFTAKEDEETLIVNVF
jgi:hypothetical protein